MVTILISAVFRGAALVWCLLKGGACFICLPEGVALIRVWGLFDAQRLLEEIQ